MPKILDDLHQDHQNFARLWDLLGRELKIFKDSGQPDYGLVETILDYSVNYPELCHHPKEDLIYEKLAARDPAAAKAVGDLKKEHETLASLTWRFSTAVGNVLEDEQLPRDWFMNIANDFLIFSRNHMQMEEVLFFPATRKCLTAKDWAELEVSVENVNDPLFGEDKQEKYKSLFQDIMDWGRMLEEMAATETKNKKKAS